MAQMVILHGGVRVLVLVTAEVTARSWSRSLGNPGGWFLLAMALVGLAKVGLSCLLASGGSWVLGHVSIRAFLACWLWQRVVKQLGFLASCGFQGLSVAELEQLWALLAGKDNRRPLSRWHLG